MSNKTKAAELLNEFKGNSFIYGIDCVNQLPQLCSGYGKKVSLILSSPGKSWSRPYHDAVFSILHEAGFQLAGDIIPGAAPNAPKEDVFRMAGAIRDQSPDFIVSVGGGSSIDASKAAIALAVLGDKYPSLDDYFGMNEVTGMLQETKRELIPMVAVEVASGSAAHLTKYSNITDMSTGQKMLIIDEAVTPPKAMFDYAFTLSAPKDLTMDGAFDGISHCLEVLMGIPEANYQKAKEVCLLGIDLIVNNVRKAVENPDDMEAREAIGLGTDLGGYAIMIGGTNGAHLNSFSLTDILSHGRAVALMNPYYVTLFAPAIKERLLEVAEVYRNAGFLKEDLEKFSARETGLALGNAMMELSRSIGFPVKLTDVQGFRDEHITRVLKAAKNPKLASKLQNMPIPLMPEEVDEVMGGLLLAAKRGILGEVPRLRL